MEMQPTDELNGGGGTAAVDTAAPANNDTASNAADPAPETTSHPTLYERIAQLEHQVSVLTANLESAIGRAEDLVEGKFNNLHAEGESWFSHLRTLIDAGIHRVEDFFGTLVHGKVTQDAATDSDQSSAG